MFEVTISQEFDAAHRLPNYDGPCSQIHGHTWKVSASVNSEVLNQAGMVIDFKVLKVILNGVLERYDHAYINDIAPFDRIDPTAENLAREIYQQLQELLVDFKLAKVSIWESSNAWATYWED